MTVIKNRMLNYAFSATCTCCLILATDHFLATHVEKRFSEKDFYFWRNYDPRRISWDDENWQSCWGGSEYLFYQYRACISNQVFPDPSLSEQNYKVFMVYPPKSIFEKLGNAMVFNTSPLGNPSFREIFYVFPDQQIERLTGGVRFANGGAVRSRTTENNPNER